VDLDDVDEDIARALDRFSIRNWDPERDRVVLWASRQTGLSASKLDEWQCQTWEIVGELAEIGDPEAAPVPGLPLDWEQRQLRFFGLNEAGAARVRDKLRGLSDLRQYLRALPAERRPCFTSLCEQGILTLKAYKIHYEQSLLSERMLELRF
jgi:hypothetical protein